MMFTSCIDVMTCWLLNQYVITPHVTISYNLLLISKDEIVLFFMTHSSSSCNLTAVCSVSAAHTDNKQTHEENKRRTRWGDVCCGSSPGWRGPSSQHAECAAAAGTMKMTMMMWLCSIQGSPSECVCVCVWGDTVGHFAPLPRAQSRAGAFSSSSVFTKSPPVCFHSHCNQLFFSVSENQSRGIRKHTHNCIFARLFVLAAFQTKPFLLTVVFAALSAELQLSLSCFSKAVKEHKKMKTIKPLIW